MQKTHEEAQTALSRKEDQLVEERKKQAASFEREALLQQLVTTLQQDIAVLRETHDEQPGAILDAVQSPVPAPPLLLPQVGIGLEITSKAPYKVKSLAEGGGAVMSQAIKIGDRVVSVNEVDVSKRSLYEIKELMLGPVGSEVRVTLERQGKDGTKTTFSTTISRKNYGENNDQYEQATKTPIKSSRSGGEEAGTVESFPDAAAVIANADARADITSGDAENAKEQEEREVLGAVVDTITGIQAQVSEQLASSSRDVFAVLNSLSRSPPNRLLGSGF